MANKNLQKKHSNKNKIISYLISVSLVGALLLFYLEKANKTYLFHDKKVAQITTQQTTATPKIDLSPANPNDNTGINKQKESPAPVPNPTPKTTPKGTGQIVLTSASQGSSTVSIRAMIYSETSGTCVIQFTPKDTSKTAIAAEGTVSKLVNGDYSCGSIEVPISQFPASGEYEVSAALNGASGTVLANNKLTINVKK